MSSHPSEFRTAAVQIYTIPLPDLAPNVVASNAEILFHKVNNSLDADSYVLDLRNQVCVCPYGVLCVLHIARVLSERSGRRVEIIGVPQKVYSYLHRVGLFEKGALWLTCSQSLEKEWSRISDSPNVLDIAFIQNDLDVINIVKHAENIFAHWLSDDEVGFLTTILSELCRNVYKHSTDANGCVIAQKYEMTGYVKVCVGVADLGVGIRRSLANAHDNLPSSESECLQAAVSGLSARGVGQIGTGLSSAANIAHRNGGHVLLRSHTGSLLLRPGRAVAQDNQPFLSGTQLSIEFRAPL